MSLLEEALAVLVGALNPAPPAFTGSVVDAAGIPLPGARVSAIRSGLWSGQLSGQATTDALGRFAVAGRRDGDVMVVTAAGVSRTVVPPAGAPAVWPADLGVLTLLTPTVLSASVGLEGTNRPLDVRRLQARLHRLGRLSDDDVAAEPVDLAAPPPVPLGPQLLRAFTDHLICRLGRMPAAVALGPDDPLEFLLDADPPVPIVSVALGSPVGALPGDRAASPINAAHAVSVVQLRLVQLGLLRPPEFAAEDARPGGAQPDPVVAAPATFAAITRLARVVADTSLTAIVPGTVVERVLRDPPGYGRRPVAVGAGVGAGAANMPDDVRRVQQRLVYLGHLSALDAAAEEPILLPGAPVEPVPDGDLTATIAALGALQAARLGAAAAAPAVLPSSAAVRRLESPSRLELTDTIGWAPAQAAPNRPADVRAVQDRLRLLGALSQADFDAEKVNPHRSERVDQALVKRTAVALALVSGQRDPLPLTGPVGRGVAAARADVRRVQDRLFGLGFLAQPAFQAESVDPAGTGAVPDAALAATYAALSTFRARVLGLPADDPTVPWSAQPVVRPGDEAAALLEDPLVAGRRPLRLRGSVGTLGWNFPDDVRSVQQRLRDLRLLPEADAAAEAVPPDHVGRIGDLQLVRTRAAIARFHSAFLGAPAPAPERIEPSSAEQRALDDPFGAVVNALELTGSVGAGGENLGADVRAVQDRLLGLGFLSPEAAERERLAPVNVPVPAALLRETIAAIGRYHRLMLGNADALVPPLSETHWTMRRPGTLREVTLGLTAGVGPGEANLGRDVRVAQDRMLDLGVLSALNYAGELAPRGEAAAIPAANLVATFDAILRLQRTFAGMPNGAPDGRISLNGRAQRVMENVAGASPTCANPGCDLAVAGPPSPAYPADTMRVIRAIEHIEGGVATGEIPAILRNASRMPASFGRGQIIGGTAVRTLQRPIAAPLAAFYGLTAARLAALLSIATAAEAAFNAVSGLMPAAVAEAVLQGRISDRVRDHGAQIRADTGLGAVDIERMFRAAQLRQHLLALPANDDAADLFNPALHPDAAVNLAALAMAMTDVRAYRGTPAFFGEHRQGFVTLAVLRAPEGQMLRQALTDDSGSKLGQVFIADNYDTTAGQGLTARQRAQVTAYLHNHGQTVAWAVAHLGTVTADPYVVNVIAWWDAHP